MTCRHPGSESKSAFSGTAINRGTSSSPLCCCAGENGAGPVLLLRECGKSRAGLAARQKAWPRRFEHGAGIDFRIDQHAHKTILHFIPVLITPGDQLLRIGIELVVRRIVVVSNSDDSGSFWYGNRLCEIVTDLPVKVPLRLENRFRLA